MITAILFFEWKTILKNLLIILERLGMSQIKNEFIFLIQKNLVILNMNVFLETVKLVNNQQSHYFLKK